jgi:anti-anti-sigma regulatory factor
MAVTARRPFGDEPAERSEAPLCAPAADEEAAALPEPETVLQVELDAAGASCRLSLRGDLCDISLAALEVQVDQLGCLPCEWVIVDIRQLDRLDPVGAKVLLGLYHYVVGRGGEMRITEANGQVTASLCSAGGDVIPAVEGLG